MPVRDLLLFGAFAAIVPTILLHPYVGALAWVVFGLLNPHRLTFGPAYDFPFAFLIAIITIIGILLTRDHRKLKGGAAGIVLVVLAAWTSITTAYALVPDAATAMWDRVIKIFGMTFVLMLLLHTKRQIDFLLMAIVLSIAFYGVKGGIWTIVHGGTNMVYGPEGSVMEGSNSLGVANAMVIPLMMHAYQQVRNRWARLGLLACVLLCGIAALGSYSRGAFLALGAMLLVLWLRSSRKAAAAALVLATALVAVPFMPERWQSRMQTIETYEQDGSAMSRINAWIAAWNIARDRVTGAGFDYPTPEIAAKYSPGPAINTSHAVFVAHSIYFQMLGEHGFVGLGLFLLFWALVWRQCAWLRRQTRHRRDLQWAYSLMSMTQASLAAYAVGGAFLNLGFWDMPYYLYALVVVTGYVVESAATSRQPAEASAAVAKPVGAVIP